MNYFVLKIDINIMVTELKTMRNRLSQKIFTILFFGATFFSADNNLSAQEKFNLKRCFEFADANNIQLRQLQMNELVSKIDVKQSKDNLLPSLNGSSSYNYTIRSLRDQFVIPNPPLISSRASSFNIGLNVNTSIFEGFARLLTIKSSELQLDVAELETEVYRNNLHLSIFSAYLEILRAEKQIEIIDKQSGLLNEQVGRTEKLINAGVLPKGDIAELEAQVAQQLSTKTNVENALELSLLNLAQQMGYENGLTIEVPANLPIPTLNDFKKYSVDKIYADALGIRPEVQANELRLGIADYNMKIAKASSLPTISFNSGLNSLYSKIDFSKDADPFYSAQASGSKLLTQLWDNKSFNLGLSANIPIFNRWQIKNNKERAKLAFQNQKLSNQSTEVELYNAIQQAYLNTRLNALDYQASQAALKSSQTAYENIKKKHDNGVATNLELNTALNNVTISQLNNNNALYAYIFAIKILDFYAGKPLTLNQ